MSRRVRQEVETQASSYGFFSNYCGPGGYGNYFRSRLDEICRRHDRNYGTIMSTGRNPYLHYNWADAIMQRELAEIGYGDTIKEKFVGSIANLIWNFKKAVTSHLQNSQEGQTSHSIENSSETMAPKRGRFGNYVSSFTPHPNAESATTNSVESVANRLEEHADVQQPDVGKITICPYVRPHYFTARLPFNIRLDNPYNAKKYSEYASADYNKFDFLLNGIYNIPTITTTPSYNASFLSLHVKPNGRDLYMKDSSQSTNTFNFDYYKVLGADVKIKFYRYKQEGYSAEHRQYMRYACVVDALGSSDTLNKNPCMWPETPGVNIVDMLPMNTGYNYREENFSYSPDMERKRIRAKADDSVSAEVTLEGWTKINKNPDYVDSLKILAKPMPATIQSDMGNANPLKDHKVVDANYYAQGADNGRHEVNDFIEVHIVYTVQFRESKMLTTWDTGFDT